MADIAYGDIFSNVAYPTIIASIACLYLYGSIDCQIISYRAQANRRLCAILDLAVIANAIGL